MSAENEENIDWHLVRIINEREKGLKQLGVGGVLFVVGIFVALFGMLFSVDETNDPLAVYRAAKEDQYVYARVQYLSESFAYYEAMENMNFYLAFSDAGRPSVLCFHTDDLDRFQPYIDWTYSDSEGDVPREYIALGYAKPFDNELKGFVLEVLEQGFGITMTEEEMSDSFGDYYVQISGRQGAYRFIQVAAVLMAIGAFALFLGALNYSSWRRFLREISHPESLEAPDVKKDHPLLFGALGALAGAVVGGALWTVIGAIGIYNFWVGFLVSVFTQMGYGIGNRKANNMGLFGLAISTIFSAGILLPATYLEWCWLYYSGSNGGVMGYIPLSRVLRELPEYIAGGGYWQEIRGELILGYVFLVFGLFVGVSSYLEGLGKVITLRKKK